MSLGNKVMCQVWLLPDTQDGQCAQLFHSFTVYVKGASPFGDLSVFNNCMESHCKLQIQTKFRPPFLTLWKHFEKRTSIGLNFLKQQQSLHILLQFTICANHYSLAGCPDVSVVAFDSPEFNIYAINDGMKVNIASNHILFCHHLIYQHHFHD